MSHETQAATGKHTAYYSGSTWLTVLSRNIILLFCRTNGKRCRSNVVWHSDRYLRLQVPLIASEHTQKSIDTYSATLHQNRNNNLEGLRQVKNQVGDPRGLQSCEGTQSVCLVFGVYRSVCDWHSDSWTHASRWLIFQALFWVFYKLCSDAVFYTKTPSVCWVPHKLASYYTGGEDGPRALLQHYPGALTGSKTYM